MKLHKPQHEQSTNYPQENHTMLLETITTGAQKTMSSREVAGLCDKRHDHVCRDIDNLNASYQELGLPKVGEGYYTHPNTGNQKHREFLLTQEQCLDLMTGYNRELRIRVNRRWAELERQVLKPQLPDFTNPSEAARAWADEFEQKQIAVQRLAIAEPKAKALDVINSSEGALNIRDTGKTLGIGQKKFIEWALDNEWLYRDSKNKLQAYSKRIQQGYMEIKATTYGHTALGPRATTQTVVTPQGLVYLSKVFSVINGVA